MEVAGGEEAVPIAIAAGGLLEPLDHRVGAFEARVGDPALDRVQHAVEMSLDHPGHALHRLQVAADRLRDRRLNVGSVSARSRVSHIVLATSFKCQQRAVFEVPSVNRLKRDHRCSGTRSGW